MTKQEIILYDSDEAARKMVGEIWVSSNDRLYITEDMARYDGCTHRYCNVCREPTEKTWLICEQCRNKKSDAKYHSFPEVQWGDFPVALYDGDQFFFDEDQFLDWCAETKVSPETVQLVTCADTVARQIDPNDYYADDLPDDMSVEDICPELAAAFNTLNQFIFEMKPTLSWRATTKRTTYRAPDAI